MNGNFVCVCVCVCVCRIRKVILGINYTASTTTTTTPFIVTHVSIRTSDTSSMPHSTPSTAYRTLLYRATTSLRPLSWSIPTLAPPQRKQGLGVL